MKHFILLSLFRALHWTPPFAHNIPDGNNKPITTWTLSWTRRTHQYDGHMKVVYTNKSPETLDKVFWHLFFNAFQPGSMMDVRSRTISDPDRRVGSRIVEFPEDEWGWQRIESVKVNGKPVEFVEDGTIMVVSLPNRIATGQVGDV